MPRCRQRFCHALRRKAEFFQHFFLLLCCIFAFAKVRVNSRYTRSYAIRCNAGCLHGRCYCCRSRRVNACNLSKTRRLVYALCNLRRSGRIMCRQIVDLVHQLHNIIMAELRCVPVGVFFCKRHLPFCHVVACGLVVQVHCRCALCRIPQHARVDLLVYANSALAQCSTYLCQLFRVTRYLCAQILDIPRQLVAVLLERLSVLGHCVAHIAHAVGQPVHIADHRCHLAFKLFGFRRAVRNALHRSGQPNAHDHQPSAASVAQRGAQRAYLLLRLADRRLQARVNLARDPDRKL